MLVKRDNKKIVSIVNQKGGVGKTTTAINIATILAKAKNRVLLIDIDPQGNSSTGFGISQHQRQKTIYEVLIDQCSIRDSIIPHKIKNLNLITATVDLAAAEIEMVNFKNREFVLKEQIDKIIDDFDYILIDCPPSLGLLTINSLTTSNFVLIPMQCEFFALEGLSHLLTTLEIIKENLNNNLEILGIILTMHDKRNKLTEQVENDVRNFLKDFVFKNTIPRNVKLSEAPSHGLPGVIYDNRCNGSLAYISLVKEIIQKINHFNS